jgi:hypothetical protein
MKLFIFSHGDPTVGLSPYEFTVECPFQLGEVDNDVLKWFKDLQLKAFQECLDCHVKAVYDFELKEKF